MAEHIRTFWGSFLLNRIFQGQLNSYSLKMHAVVVAEQDVSLLSVLCICNHGDFVAVAFSRLLVTWGGERHVSPSGADVTYRIS